MREQGLHALQPKTCVPQTSDGRAQFRGLLATAGSRQSMSARANPHHNAWTESFLGTLKAEMLQGAQFIDPADAATEIFAFIDAYHNTHRLHPTRVSPSLAVVIRVYSRATFCL